MIKKSLPFHIKETWFDNYGCFTAIHGEWEGEEVILLNVYAPPGLQAETLHRVGELLVNTPKALTILGGDFNLVLDTQIDRASTKPEGVATLGKLEGFTQALGLGDIWRDLHKNKKALSYYSGAHDMHSRLDYMFTTRDGLCRFTEASYLARGISDHSPLIVTMQGGRTRERGEWIMATWRLANRKEVERLDKATEHYFRENMRMVASV